MNFFHKATTDGDGTIEVYISVLLLAMNFFTKLWQIFYKVVADIL